MAARKQCYDCAIEMMESSDDLTVNQQEIVEALMERYPKKSWNSKTVGSYMKPLVSSGMVLRVRKRVLGIMATYYTLDMLKYKETPKETHVATGQADNGRI